jgi:hypothetical protein
MAEQYLADFALRFFNFGWINRGCKTMQMQGASPEFLRLNLAAGR